jgi:hypothetical protein
MTYGIDVFIDQHAQPSTQQKDAQVKKGLQFIMYGEQCGMLMRFDPFQRRIRNKALLIKFFKQIRLHKQL